MLIKVFNISKLQYSHLLNVIRSTSLFFFNGLELDENVSSPVAEMVIVFFLSICPE